MSRCPHAPSADRLPPWALPERGWVESRSLTPRELRLFSESLMHSSSAEANRGVSSQGSPFPSVGVWGAGGGAGDGQGHVGVAQGPALPTAVSASLATIPSTPPISTEASLGAHRGHLSPLWESALAFPPTLLTLGSRGIPLEGQGTWLLCCLGLRSWVDVLGRSPLRFLCALGSLTATS